MPITTLDSRLPDAVVGAPEVLQEWVACVGVVPVEEVEAALGEAAHLLHPIHTGRDQPQDLGHQLRLVGEENTGRGHLHFRGVDPGPHNHPRVEEAEDGTRMITTAVAAQVATATVVATVAAEAGREIAGVTAEQPSMSRLAGTCQPCLRLGQIQGSLMSKRVVACKNGDALSPMGRVAETGALTCSGVSDNFETEFGMKRGGLSTQLNFQARKVNVVMSLVGTAFR